MNEERRKRSQMQKEIGSAAIDRMEETITSLKQFLQRNVYKCVGSELGTKWHW